MIDDFKPVKRVTPQPSMKIPSATAPVYKAPANVAPVHKSPVHKAQVHSTPVHTTPIHTTPIHSAPIHEALTHEIPKSATAEKVSPVNTPKPKKIKFLKRHKLLIAIVSFILVVAIAAYCIIPDIGIGNQKFVNVGVSTRLELGQTIRLKQGNVSAIIKNFSNTPCPTGVECFGSGPTVEYQLSINGQKYATGTQTKADGAKYQIETDSTDYSTYAVVKIVNSP